MWHMDLRNARPDIPYACKGNCATKGGATGRLPGAVRCTGHVRLPSCPGSAVASCAGLRHLSGSMAKSQRFRKFRKSSRTWEAPALPWLLGLFGGVFAALAVAELQGTVRRMAVFAHEGTLAPFWAFLFGFVAVALPVMAVQKATERLMR